MTSPAQIMDETIQRIESNPTAWQQWDWSRCFASHAVEVAKAHQDVQMDDSGNEHVRNTAMKVLGINDIQSNFLFAGVNNLTDLKVIIKAINTQNESGSASAGFVGWNQRDQAWRDFVAQLEGSRYYHKDQDLVSV